MMLGNMHCYTPHRDGIRRIKSVMTNWKEIPKPLRRGFYLCVIETLDEYRSEYNYVMSGSPVYVDTTIEGYDGGEYPKQNLSCFI